LCCFIAADKRRLHCGADGSNTMHGLSMPSIPAGTAAGAGLGDCVLLYCCGHPLRVDADIAAAAILVAMLLLPLPRRQGLRCRERLRGSYAWAVYSHETRMVLVGSAAAPRSALAAWQFASHGIVHLPLFELQVRQP
jgi:hypothetical protein